MFHSSCGAAVKGGNAFCEQCGAPVAASGGGAITPPTHPPTAAPAVRGFRVSGSGTAATWNWGRISRSDVAVGQRRPALALLDLLPWYSAFGFSVRGSNAH